MKEIPLTQGKVALVDDEDFERLAKFKWLAQKHRRIYYAFAQIEGKYVYMHRLVMDAKPNTLVDHKNVNGLDNQKANLRVCTYAQNSQNMRKRMKKASSQYKGVCYLKKSRNWLVQIQCNKVRMIVGRFANEVDAARAYDEKAKELFGEYARFNFPA